MLMIGETVSHYRILGKLGGGGMGVVYEAEDTRLGRRVALKFIPDNLAGDPKSLERFEREAKAASQLNHPNICTIHDIQDNNGHPFIVMEKLEGESLKQLIHGKPMDCDQILEIAIQVADALAASVLWDLNAAVVTVGYDHYNFISMVHFASTTSIATRTW